MLFRNILIPVLLLAILLPGFKSDKKTFALFDDLGKKSNYNKILKKAQEADIILFGELHNNPINHWIELELAKDIFEKVNENVVMGAEMYESDNQTIINEYLSGHFPYNTFKREAKVWPNDETDYVPLLDFALSNQLTFVATNIPRRYAKMVYDRGFSSLNGLTKDAKNYIAPLPINFDAKLPGYQKIKKMAGKHKSEYLAESQAIKDATMAHFIIKNWSKGKIFIHYNGAYHSNNFDGIFWHLQQANEDLKILTVNCVEQDQMESLDKEHHSSAHFIMVTPSTMTKTH